MAAPADTGPLTPHRIVLGDNSVYALPLADGGALLVDAGPDVEDSWTLAVAQLAAGGFAPADVRAVLVTHGHVDHAGLAARWAAAGTRILVGAADRPLLLAGAAGLERTRAARRRELLRNGYPGDGSDLASAGARSGMRWQPAPAPAVYAVADGERLALAGGETLRVIAAPGHTPGNLVALAERAGDLYSGDTLLGVTIPTPGLHFPAGADGPRWPSLPPFLDSVRALERLAVRRVLPGHGEPVAEPGRLFARFRAHHERRARRLRALLAERPDSAYGLVRRLFPHLPRARVPQAMTEAIGHLDVLVAAGEAAPEEVAGGVLVYRPSPLPLSRGERG